MSAGILSLCTGYGGLDLAVEAVTGARTVAVSDLDKGANKILAHRFPNVPNLGDLKAIDWQARVGTEVMTAGYPCQPFSHAGKREGTDDPRHIFPFIADGIRIVGPRLVVLENVRGHLALGFDTVLGTLADIGYDARWVCVRASDVGAPHRRERLFIIATPDADRLGHERARGARGRREGSADHGASAPDASGERHGRREDSRGLGRLDGAHEGGTLERERPREVTGDRGAEVAAHAQGDEQREPLLRLGERPESGRGDIAPADPERGGLDGWPPHKVRLTVERTPATRGSEGDRSGVEWGQYAPAINRWATVLGRPAPAPTEPGAKGQPRLSPRFVEHMMGLPEGWVTDVPDLTRNEQLKALGNGVVPQQAAAALTFLLDARQAVA